MCVSQAGECEGAAENKNRLTEEQIGEMGRRDKDGKGHRTERGENVPGVVPFSGF